MSMDYKLALSETEFVSLKKKPPSWDTLYFFSNGFPTASENVKKHGIMC